MRRLKRRIPIGQFKRWRQFAQIAPFDPRHRDVMQAQQVVLLAKAVGDNRVTVEDIVGDPFGNTPHDDMATILQAFNTSG